MLPIWGGDDPKGLGQDDVGHHGNVVHAQGLCPLHLAWVDGVDAAADRFRHIGSGVEGDDQDGRLEGVDIDAEPLGKAVEYDHGLDDHGGAPEHSDVDLADDPRDEQQDLFDRAHVPVQVHRLDQAHHKAQAAARQRAGQGGLQGGQHPLEVGIVVLLEQKDDPLEECGW